MPKALHQALNARAREHGFRPGTKDYNAYVYGTLDLVEKRRKHFEARRDASETLRTGESDERR